MTSRVSFLSPFGNYRENVGTNSHGSETKFRFRHYRNRFHILVNYSKLSGLSTPFVRTTPGPAKGARASSKVANFAWIGFPGRGHRQDFPGEAPTFAVPSPLLGGGGGRRPDEGAVRRAMTYFEANPAVRRLGQESGDLDSLAVEVQQNLAAEPFAGCGTIGSNRGSTR
jgi:hypothetical protein